MISDYEILNYLSGKCSQSEAKRIETWIDADQANKAYFVDLQSLYESSEDLNTYKKVDVDQEWEVFKQNIKEIEHPETVAIENPKSTFRKFIPYAVAASVAILALVYINITSPSQELKIVEVNTAETLIANTLNNTQELVLADGSKVTLLENSKLQYPSTFDFDPTRSIVLMSGEAILDISHDATKKFIVTCGEVGVEVLGTKFSIKKSEIEEVNINLLSGSIKAYQISNELNSINLTPGDNVNFSSNQFIKINALPKSTIVPPTPLNESNSSIYHLADVLKFLDDHYSEQIRIDKKLKIEKTEEIKINLNQKDLSSIVRELSKHSKLQVKPGKCDTCYIIVPIKKK